MKKWYESAFGKDYLALYPHRNDEEARRDVGRICRLIAPPKHQPLLDLCCGAGRHLEALHRAGFSDLVGLDLSADLLEEAKTRFDRAGIDGISLHQADMREIPFADRFATILSMFTSFGYFKDSEDDLCVLRGAHRALREGGTLLLDTMNRGFVIRHLEPKEVREDADWRLHITRRLSEDGTRVEKETKVVSPGREDSIYRESVRMYTEPELEELLTRAGFERVVAYGGLDGQTYHESGPRMVLVARRQVSRET